MKAGTRKHTFRMFCSSAKCLKKALPGNRGTETDHEHVDSSRDKRDGWKVNGIQTQGGCRDSRADYRTVRCCECGAIGTYDFATD